MLVTDKGRARDQSKIDAVNLDSMKIKPSTFSSAKFAGFYWRNIVSACQSSPHPTEYNASHYKDEELRAMRIDRNRIDIVAY